MKDLYKANIIMEHIKKMGSDDFYLVRLKGDSKELNPINIDREALEMLLQYYLGHKGDING